MLSIEQQKTKDAKEKAERIRNFTYESCPYLAPYDTLDHATIRKHLCQATCFKEIKNALSAFSSLEIGYAANRPWLKEWVALCSERIIDSLFPAFCFSDKDICDSLIQDGYVLKKERALEVIRRFARIDADDKAVAFIARYVELSKENAKYFSENMKWLPFIDAHDFKSLEYFQSMGLDVRIGDEGLELWKHTDWNMFYSNEYRSPLSMAIEKNDVSRVKLLLEWGANPNQRLYFSVNRSPGSTPLHLDPLLYHIRSREIFDLMAAAGMEFYPVMMPDEPENQCNLVESMWTGKAINPEEVKFMEYLYSIDYDKPLVKKISSIRESFEKHEGRPYDKNIQYVQKWLTRVSRDSETN